MTTKPSSTAAFIAWNWAIESLATLKQLNASDVTDLVETTPGGPDNLGESAKEIFSFRVLESLFVSGTGITKTCSPAPDSKIGFDQSDRCADVLEHILREIPGPNLKDELETLKWDVQAFILHKRSCLPKCALGQLKDAILQGSHPRLASLKERAGLLLENWSEGGIHVDDGDCSGFPNIIEGSTDGQTVATRISSAVNPEYEVDPFKEISPERNIVLNKTVQSSLDKNIEKTTCKDFGTEVPSGKSKEGESQSFFFNEEGYDENEGSDKVSTTLNDEAKDDTESELSADSIGYLKEMSDITTKKHALLSYKCMLTEENDVETHKKDLSNCVHCNKGGQLLVCSSDACPLVIHERCLTSADTFDSRGKFYCYFCAYSQLVSDFQDAKQSYSLARKNLAASICRGMKDSPAYFFKKSYITEQIAESLDKQTHKRKRKDVDQVGGTRYKSNREVEKTGTSVFYAAAVELSERKRKAVNNGKGSLLDKD